MLHNNVPLLGKSLSTPPKTWLCLFSRELLNNYLFMLMYHVKYNLQQPYHVCYYFHAQLVANVFSNICLNNTITILTIYTF